MRIRLLGPVELWVGARQAALGGPNQRTLLALLALHPGETVSRDRAAEALWGESPPEGYPQRLHTIVSRLRAAVREAGGRSDVVETTETGYRLRIDPSRVDATEAASALRQARDMRVAGRLVAASGVARDALDLWRGPPIIDLADNGWASDDLRRLEELKLSLLEEDFDCRLSLGASAGLVEELETACAAAPLRERLHAQLMLALDASGRRADALHEYDRMRHRLSEELGIDPGPLLREAHRTVLADERAERGILVPEPQLGDSPGRRTVLIAAGVTAAGLVATAGVLLAHGGRDQARAALRTHAGELVIATPGLRSVRAEIPLSGTIINEQPGGIVSADGSLWFVTEQGTVTQVDLARGRLVGSTPLALPTGPGGMAVGLGATWVTDSGSATLYRLLPGVTAARQITLPPLKNTRGLGTEGVTVAGGSIWVVREAGVVDRLSPEGQLEHRFRIPGAKQLVGQGRGIWVLAGQRGVVTKLDAHLNRVLARTHLRPTVCCLAVGGGSVWATSEERGLLWQLRPDGTIDDVIHVPAPATEVAYGDGAVWISGYTSRTVTRVDAQTLAVRTVHVGQPVAGLAAAPGVVAFSTFASHQAALLGVRGPIARIVLGVGVLGDSDPATPGFNGDRDAEWQMLGATCLSLFESTGRRLVPDAAAGPAERLFAGRIWTFHIRPGFAFSPPSNERVDAATFAATIERSTAPTLHRSAAAVALADVVGMNAYRRGLTTHVAGVEAAGHLLTIRLQRPVADLDRRLAAPYFCAVPKETPVIPHGLQGPIPSAGPYYVAGVRGGSWLVLRRNPHYPRPHAGFDAFAYTFGVDPRRALGMIGNGRADYAAVYDAGDASALVAQLGAVGDAIGVRFRLSSRPGGGGKRIAELFGRRVGCRSYGPLYAGVELKRLCPVAG